MSAIIIQVQVATQSLVLKQANQVLCSYSIATASKGLGEQVGSEKTPRGYHIVHQKLGDNEPIGCVFNHRLVSAECYTPELGKQQPHRDWILTRIIRLAGLELDFNLGQEVDSLQRCIYIHGSPDHLMANKAGSHGCIRMYNKDIIQLYDRIQVGTMVCIN